MHPGDARSDALAKIRRPKAVPMTPRPAAVRPALSPRGYRRSTVFVDWRREEVEVPDMARVTQIVLGFAPESVKLLPSLTNITHFGECMLVCN